MIHKLYTGSDIENLSNDNIKDIRRNLTEEFTVLAKDFNREYISNNLEQLLKIPDISKIIEDNIFTMKGSFKWFRFRYDNNFTEDKLRSKLESLPGYDIDMSKKSAESLKINSIIGISSDENIYTMKILVSDGYRKVSNGIKSNKEKVLKTLIVKIDTKQRWVEIRGNEKNAIKVKEILEQVLNIKNLNPILILNKYKNKIEDFKNDLHNGFLLDSSSIPAQDIKLSQSDASMIKNIFMCIDKYLIDKDVEDLQKVLEEVHFCNKISFREIMLAGLDSFNIKIRNDSSEDISKQAFYSIFKDFMVEDSSYITFSDSCKKSKYTIQLGIHTNTIVFRSNTTESIIEYIRNKIV